MSVPTRQLFIDGIWTQPAGGRRLDVVNPATEEVIGTIPAGNAENAERAVAAAVNAFRRGDWSKMSGGQRAKFLRAIAKKVRFERRSGSPHKPKSPARFAAALNAPPSCICSAHRASGAVRCAQGEV